MEFLGGFGATSKDEIFVMLTSRMATDTILTSQVNFVVST